MNLAISVIEQNMECIATNDGQLEQDHGTAQIRGSGFRHVHSHTHTHKEKKEANFKIANKSVTRSGSTPMRSR